jgi:tRNA-specific 2-thiouridylase
MSIAVAVSGGRDSLLALALLAEYHGGEREIAAVHGLFLPGEADRDHLVALEAACAAVGARLHVLDLRAGFHDRVVQPFIDAYARGETPNPCAVCNRRVKFGLIWEWAAAHGFGAVATGHYARILDHPRYGRALARGRDETKEQSYFLSLVEPQMLGRIIFPLGEWRKEDVGPELARRGLAPAQPAESQEICFVPDDDYRGFLLASGAELSGPGPIVLRDGTEVGRHEGLWRHTLGQRRGLGVAWSEPLYVLTKDAARNALVVGPKAELGSRSLTAGRVNVLVPPELWPDDLLVKTRYRTPPRRASVRLEGGELRVEFAEVVGPPTPGQVAAVYDTGGVVLAGGVIG